MADARKTWSARFDQGRFGKVRYRYVLTPWEWDAVGAPYWRLPASAVGGVDLRPLAAQGAAGGTPDGFAFCASMQPVGVEVATALHMAEENATSGMQDAWQAAMGYRPQGAKLVDLLWDQLTTGSDPSGESGPKPLIPGVDSVLRLHVGGHSLVKSERFRFGVHAHTGKVRDLLRRQFESQWEATNGDDHCRRCLDFTCKKYRVDDWREFVPPRLHAHVPGRLPHATTITESFDKANSSTLGPDLTWTEFLGASNGDWSVVSNTVRCVAHTAPSGTLWFSARAESDLSSDDHYAQIPVSAIGASSFKRSGLGGAVRFDASAETYYGGAIICQEDAGNTKTGALVKLVAGVATSLTEPAHAWAMPSTIKAEANGSTLTMYDDGASAASVTDTAITGNVRTGLVGASTHFGADSDGDNFEAADLGGAPPASNRRRRLICGAAA